MNIRTLQIFKTVCEKGNITKASQQLYMTQPAVSHAIKDLEDELQVQLFDRYGKRIYLNEIGKLFLSKVQRTLSSFDELQHVIPILETYRTIKIGSSITIANDYLPDILFAFKEVYPHVKTIVFVESARHIAQRLKNHEIDIALVEGVIQNPNWKQEVLSTYDLCIVCSKQHDKANKKVLQWREIKQVDWLLRECGSAVRDSFDSACRLHQILIEPIWTSVNSQALLQAVRKNLGVTILPCSIVETFPYKEELQILTIEKEHLQNENHIIYDNDLYLDDAKKELITIMKNIHLGNNRNF